MGDDVELQAISRLLGSASVYTSVSSTKGATGHLLGAAGALESLFCVKAVSSDVCPPTLNLNKPASAGKNLDLVPLVSKR